MTTDYARRQWSEHNARLDAAEHAAVERRELARVVRDLDAGVGALKDAGSMAAFDRLAVVADRLDRFVGPKHVAAGERARLRLMGAEAAGRLFLRARAQTRKGLPADEMLAIASTEAMASDGLVVRKQAWNRTLARARESGWFPRFLAGHQHHAPDGGPPTIGKIVAMRWIDREGLEIHVRFAPASVTPLGPRYAKAFADGYLTDLSVSWTDTRFAPEHEWANRDVPEIVDLLCDEISAVSVGADAGAKKRPA